MDTLEVPLPEWHTCYPAWTSLTFQLQEQQHTFQTLRYSLANLQDLEFFDPANEDDVIHLDRRSKFSVSRGSASIGWSINGVLEYHLQTDTANKTYQAVVDYARTHPDDAVRLYNEFPTLTLDQALDLTIPFFHQAIVDLMYYIECGTPEGTLQSPSSLLDKSGWGYTVRLSYLDHLARERQQKKYPARTKRTNAPRYTYKDSSNEIWYDTTNSTTSFGYNDW